MSEPDDYPEYEPDPIQCANKCGTWIDAGRCDIIDLRDESLQLPPALTGLRYWNAHVCRDCYHSVTGLGADDLQAPPEENNA